MKLNQADFVHLSPARFEHINPYGRYEFDVAKTFSRQELRPSQEVETLGVDNCNYTRSDIFRPLSTKY